MSEGPTIKQVRNTMYDKMEFPQYQYREFPMAVPVVDGVIQDSPYNAKRKAHPVVIVNSQEELDALKSEAANLIPMSDAPGAPKRVETEDDVRKTLYVRADQLGVKIDKRWSVDRIREELGEETVI